MAEPKKKLSKTRTHLRRAKYGIELPQFGRCKNCGEPVPPHQICQACGYYKGAAVKPERPKERIVVDKDK